MRKGGSMAPTIKAKYALQIMEMLGTTYQPDSRPYQMVRKFLSKGSVEELDALWAMVTTMSGREVRHG